MSYRSIREDVPYRFTARKSAKHYEASLFQREVEMNLKDAVAVITGGGSGLGEATAREFASGGARIVVLDLPNSPGPKVAESLGEKGLFVAADVVSGDAVEAAIAAASKRFGTINVAVNCAGVGRAQRTVSKDGPHSLDLLAR